MVLIHVVKGASVDRKSGVLQPQADAAAAVAFVSVAQAPTDMGQQGQKVAPTTSQASYTLPKASHSQSKARPQPKKQSSLKERQYNRYAANTAGVATSAGAATAYGMNKHECRNEQLYNEQCRYRQASSYW